jgi:multidrug transporter EmrE-like cation transporter
MGYLYITLTILCTVYGQIVIKWQVGLAGQLPANAAEKIIFLLQLFLNPWIISGFASAFLASLAWMAAMSKFPLNYAYPFMSLSFVLVLLISPLLLNEAISVFKIIGMLLIIFGIIVSSQG